MTATASKRSRKRGRDRGGSQPPATPAAPAVAVDDWSYRQLDWLRERFDIGDQIGYGSFKDVFRARDRITGNDVALGVYVGPAPESVRFLERHEAARLCGDHPNVARVLSSGVVVDDYDVARAYVAMTLVENAVTAHQAVVCQGRPLPVPAVMTYCHGVLRGLRHLHAHGLVHGSAHPQNVLVDPGGYPVIADFDWVMQPGDTRIQPGQLVAIVGPHQVSPEQLRGLPHDDRADLFVGAIGMYLVATGRYPFDPEHADAHSRGHDFIARLDRLPETPRTLNPLLPERLSNLLLAMLTPDPAHRPQTASEALNELTKTDYLFHGFETSVLVT